MGIMDLFKKKDKKIEETKKEETQKPKCKNCGNEYNPDAISPDSYAHLRGFCKSECVTDYLLKRVDAIDESMELLAEEIENIDTNVKLSKGEIGYLDERQKKVVKYLLNEKKKRK